MNRPILPVVSMDGERRELLVLDGSWVNVRREGQETQLHKAVQNHDLALVENLIEDGADINAGSNSLLETPLHVAAMEGFGDIAALLLKYGADVNSPMQNQATPLLVAARNGRENVVKELLKNPCCKVNLVDRMGRTALMAAVEAQHPDVVRVLLEHGFSDLRHCDYPGRTLAHHAVIRRSSDILQLLFAAGASAEQPDSQGAYPLHIAVRKGYLDIVSLLLSHGCEVNVHHGVRHWETPLTEAVRVGHIKIVETLLEAGADTEISPCYDYGNSLFAFFLSNRMRLDILHLLLIWDVNVNYRNAYGYSALHFAVDKGWCAAARLLVLADCDLSKEADWLKQASVDVNNSLDASAFYKWIIPQVSFSTTKSLKIQCRQQIRRLLGASGKNIHVVPKLGLPTILADFVMYKDLM